ncbi:Putative SOS response-associated peptidase YedK [Sulfitobacter sp. THAF37]|uniref:SOS response-associated peptidase n=1 Tax=Sulfitobacter sp. THAF37 TaxID=2587855 RepID=UPI0012687145|nr:SOS response-associated peptidase [Sulfitobacter sp. THAF37]QFT58747.1 Putative SOS response-associated peptidase YedK [Sulfitobacter sp. THAF37]
MPGRLFLTAPIPALAAELGVPAAGLADEPPRANIAPGQQIVTLTEAGLVPMRWGIVPVGRVNARGRPVMEMLVNARSETVFDKSAFAGTGRAVVPVNGWYEWTGEKRRKTAWRIAPVGGGFLYFAAITDLWQAPGGMQVAQVATLTCPPNGDVGPVHHRMGVLLARKDIQTWLTSGEEAVRPLMRPWPDGRLQVTQAGDVDWSAP